MHPFDPRCWVYDCERMPSESMVRLISTLRTSASDLGGDLLLDAFAFGGGKAFGLKLCQIIARTDDCLHVPDWLVVSPHDQLRLVMNDRMLIENVRQRFGDAPLMLRSSDIEEDWHSPESGAQCSLPCTLEELPLLLARFHRRWQPVVLQRQVSGVGIVVDIAWSDLLQSVASRVATGRVYKDRFSGSVGYSSATWDKEGLIRLWDASRHMVAARLHHGVVLDLSVYQLPLDQLAETLFVALSALGFDFGVQLELIIDPAEPTRWHLVQIRPSPGQVRNFLALPGHLGEPLTTTPVVNRPFDVAGEVVAVGPKDRDLLLKKVSNFPGDQLVFERYRGKVMVWDEPTSADTWRVDAVRQLADCGAVGQISRGVIFLNTVHGNTDLASMSGEHIRTSHDPERRSKWEQANRTCAVLGLDDQGYDAVATYCRAATEPRLRLVSDGLAGQVFPA